MNDATIIVLAKAPVPGLVKTRLCPPCTPVQAADIARAAIGDTIAAVRATPGVRPLLVLDGAPGDWLPRGVDVVPQVTGDLAVRIAGAFAASDGPTVLIGMDTPQVTPTDLRGAVDTLLSPAVDAVLGPTVDGGWWIVGFRTHHRDAFLDVPMSTTTTGAEQAARLHALGLTMRWLPSTTDVDTFGDAIAVASTIPDTAFAGAVRQVERELEPARREST